MYSLNFQSLSENVLKPSWSLRRDARKLEDVNEETRVASTKTSLKRRENAVDPEKGVVQWSSISLRSV